MGYNILEQGNSAESSEIRGSDQFIGLELGSNFSRSEVQPFDQWDNCLVPAMEIPSASRRARAPNIGAQVASCSVDGCNSDLSKCRDYHRRHKVCELHSKTPTVTIRGQEQRFCQQCSRFHSLSEFDDGKRSCRKRLDGHNRRRRKPQTDSLSLTAGRFFSDLQGARFAPISASAIFAASSPGDFSWPGSVVSENDSLHHGVNHHQQLLKYNGQSALFPGSAFHDVRTQVQYPPAPGVNNTRFMSAQSPSESNLRSSPIDANRVIATGRAFSLLSPSAETPINCPGHVMQPEPTSSTQSRIAQWFHHSRMASEKPVSPLLSLDCTIDSVFFHHQGLNNHQPANSGGGIPSSNPTPPFSWEHRT